jgi:hypothetical protein
LRDRCGRRTFAGVVRSVWRAARQQWLGTSIALLALFVALGGTSVAGTAITSAKRLIKGKDVAPRAITSRHVKDRSLRRRDFAPGQLPRGPRGRAGATGATGPQGPPGVDGTDATIDGVAAGGDLTGTYPNPSLAADTVTGADIDESTLGSVPNADRIDNLDSSQLVTGSGTLTQHVVTLSPDFFDQVVADEAGYAARYLCPSPPATSQGFFRWADRTNPWTAWWDTGGADPEMHASVPAGFSAAEPTTAAGDVHVLRTLAGSRVTTVWMTSQHSATGCTVTLQVLTATA